VVLHDYALYKSTFTLLYFTLPVPVKKIARHLIYIVVEHREVHAAYYQTLSKPGQATSLSSATTHQCCDPSGVLAQSL